MPEPLLLDTHVWLWLMQGDARLAPAVIERIDTAARVAAPGARLVTHDLRIRQWAAAGHVAVLDA